jgi:hypothetical protein
MAIVLKLRFPDVFSARFFDEDDFQCERIVQGSSSLIEFPKAPSIFRRSMFFLVNELSSEAFRTLM